MAEAFTDALNTISALREQVARLQREIVALKERCDVLEPGARNYNPMRHRAEAAEAACVWLLAYVRHKAKCGVFETNAFLTTVDSSLTGRAFRDQACVTSISHGLDMKCTCGLNALLTATPEPDKHLCSGCHLRWDGPLVGATLCGDCWRKGQAAIFSGLTATEGEPPRQPSPSPDKGWATKIVGQCRDCGTTLWSYREPHCGACGSVNLADAEGEVVVAVITKDADGDYFVRDPSRDGCLVHSDTEVTAIQLFITARADYDAAIKGKDTPDHAS